MSENKQKKKMNRSVILWTLIGIASAAVIAFCIYCFAVVIPEKREAERLALEEQRKQQELEQTMAPTATTAPTSEPTETPGLTEKPTPTEPTATVKPTAEPTETVAPTETPVITEEPTVAPAATSTPEPTATPKPTNTPVPTATSTPIPTPTEVPHEHKWADKEQPATCTTGGRTWEECKCGEIQNEVILEATGHGKLIYTVTKEPTTEAEGKYKETCEVCGTVVNEGNIKKLDPTPIPTATSTPTPKPTNTPTPTATPKPTNTPVPTATSTPMPNPTAKPVFGEIMISSGETNITLTTLAPVEYTIFLGGGPNATELEYAIARDEILDVRLTKGNNDKQYTLKLQANGMNGKTGIVLTLYGTDEYGNRVVCDEVTISVKVEIKEYDPVADGYPVFVETWTYEGFTMEVWQVDKAGYRSSVLIVTGEGEVTRDICLGWTTYLDYNRSIEKMYFSDGITKISSGLPTEATKEVRLPSTLKELGSGAFRNSIHLEEVILPEGLERIDRGAFSHCYELERVVLPSTLKYIGRGAFTHKVQSPTNYENILKEVTIPKSVEWIGYGAFEYRYDLMLTLESGIDTSSYEEGWNYDGMNEPLTMITE